MQTSVGFTTLGIDTVAPIVARGVLLDLAGLLRLRATKASAGELERAASGLEIRRGDVVLIRLGSGALWADRAAYLRAGGVSADAPRWLAAARRPWSAPTTSPSTSPTPTTQRSGPFRVTRS